MTTAPEFVPCASCGKLTRSAWAPRIRVFEGEIAYFCCPDHAEDFSSADLRQGQQRQEARPRGLDPSPAAPTAAATNTELFHATADESLAEQPPSTRSEQLSEAGHARGLGIGAQREALAPRPYELVPLAFLAILTVVSLVLGVLGQQRFALGLPLTLIGAAGLLLWERRLLGGIARGSRLYAESVRVALEQCGYVRTDTGRTAIAAKRVRAGHELRVLVGETVCADGVVVSGDAEIAQPMGEPRQVHPGQAILAGSRLVSGDALVIRAQRVGRDRALTRLVGSALSSTAEGYVPVRLGRALAWGFAPLFGVLGAIASYALGSSGLDALGLGCAIWACLGSAFLHSGSFWFALDRLVHLESRGTVFPSAEVLQAAGNVGTAVFCARGTVLKGQPEVAEVHALRGVTERDVLELAAGALASVRHPAAEAVLAAIEERGFAPHPCRSHNPQGGANMKCRNQAGHDLAIGGREFLLRQRISIAWVEDRLRNIEAQAQTVLLLAEEDQLIGILALADDLAEGARATMQRLLESGLDPALLSGDSRETTEALARRLHIDHVRPEAKPTERRKEVERLRTAGLPVAVIGRLGIDDASLLGADLPILLGGVRGYSPSFSAKDESRSLAVWSGRLMDAGSALIVAHELRQDCARVLMVRAIPTLLATVAAALLVVPAPAIPALSWAGQALAWRVLAKARRDAVV